MRARILFFISYGKRVALFPLVSFTLRPYSTDRNVSENNKNRNRKKSIPRVYFSKSNTKGYISATTTTDNRQLQPIIPIGKLFIIDFLARFSCLVSTFVCTILWYMSTLTTYILYNTLNEMWYLCLAISLLFCSHSHALRRWPSQTV